MNIKPGGTYVDATVGPGGHSELLLSQLDEGGTLYCLDRDSEVLEVARGRFGHDPRCRFIHAEFLDMAQALRAAGQAHVDGVLMDLGVSMRQLKSPERGFGFDSDAPLDMRMDQTQDLTAGDIVNTWSEFEIARVIFEYAEERRSRRIAAAIVERRRRERIETCRELSELVARVMGKRGKSHPATRTFQGLRIAVNREFEQVEGGLAQACEVLSPGGHLVVIAYHSLEDRIVKNFIRDRARQGSLSMLTKKPLTATRQEMRMNPSSRSAKLRAAEVLEA